MQPSHTQTQNLSKSFGVYSKRTEVLHCNAGRFCAVIQSIPCSFCKCNCNRTTLNILFSLNSQLYSALQTVWQKFQTPGTLLYFGWQWQYAMQQTGQHPHTYQVETMINGGPLHCTLVAVSNVKDETDRQTDRQTHGLSHQQRLSHATCSTSM